MNCLFYMLMMHVVVLGSWGKHGGRGPLRRSVRSSLGSLCADIPFGERYQMRMTYYKVDKQPLTYKHKSPFDVAW